MPKKLTKEQINSDLLHRNIELLTDYNGTRSLGTFRCLLGHEWRTTINSVRQGSGCPICFGNHTGTKEIFNSSISNRNIELISEYINSSTKSTFKCSFNHVWEATPASVKHGNGCPHCKDWIDGGFLYIMESSKGTKIGISNNPERRLRDITYSSGIPDLKIVFKYLLKSKNDALVLEKKLHNIFKDKNLKYKNFDGASEFFDIKPIDAILVILGEIF